MLRDDQVRRYARHVLLPDMGGRGQERLLAGSARVEVGPGDAAAVAALAYLAAAGVGRLELCGAPHAPVSEADAQRGILFGFQDVGRPRLPAIRARISAINPDVTVAEGGAGPADVSPERASTVADALICGGAAAAAAIERIRRATS